MTADAAPSTPHDATTVILMRPCDSDDSDFELFMVKRHGKSAFMANAYVYPGGRLEDGDRDPALLDHTTGWDDSDHETGLPGLRSPSSRALLLAGVREAFEEAGVLLAHAADDPERRPIELGDTPHTLRFARWRAALQADEHSLLDMARDEHLAFPLDQLHPFAHWITPEVEPRRYDTWFVVARCPPDQELAHDEKETVDSLWVTPADALKRYAEGEMQLAPPTFRTLEELDALGTMARVEARCEQEPIPAIMPHFVSEDGDLVLILPGDPEYPDPDAEPVSGSTRIELSEGRWWSR